MELLIIRHGQSEADLLEVHEGRADFPLTELGEQQARLMAQYVEANVRPDIILTSPLKRAEKTANLLQEAIDCKLIEIDDLREFNNGVLAGMARKEAAIKYPLPDGGRPIHVPIQDGESELDFRFRAEKIFNKIILDYKQHNRVAIVSHGGLISNFLKAVLNLPNNNKTIFATGDTGMHLIDIREDCSIIKFLNKQDHLMK
ncbi:histidine phosphatase family protein [Ureibacillus aquaedulcis]|uniref:Histidine phosphatase family protein n=1 Tax=Ureibacillus aquaedulcis TaxID=3058421 RepID=A0ABT8GTY4_9BACL|nr:histidine phosphatase family protein [Ureibacillus sp. BA0131]MDN4494870.1 histidine phosphatase family protein [Ureibacillus sp. BA0131]